MITENELIELGYSPDLLIRQMLDRIDQHQQNGINDKAYILKLLKREFGEPNIKIKMRKTALPFGMAIEATCTDDEKNIDAVKGYMNALLKTPVIIGGAVMPDACPAGSAKATIPVGGVIAVKNALIPAAHSADICCSMYASFYLSEGELSKEMDALVASTRFGPGGRHPKNWVYHPVIDEAVWDNKFLNGLKDHAKSYMADQGDGNHFAYIGEVSFSRSQITQLREAGYTDIAEHLNKNSDASQKYRVLVTHHGSRGLGAHVYKRGQNAAIKHTKKIAEDIPEAAVWLDFDTEEGKEYWEALQYVSRWTLANHQKIHERFFTSIEKTAVTSFGNEHNFVWEKEDAEGNPIFLHGKGATPAWKDEQGRPLLGLIPLNMSAPILMVLGKNNTDCLGFAPHGAGRNISRTALKKRFYTKVRSKDPEVVEAAISKATKGLDIRWFCGKPDLSESPIAYKNADQVIEQIEQFDLANIVAKIQPLGSIMAGESEIPYWKKKREALTPKQKRQIEHRADRRSERQQLKQQNQYPPSDLLE